MNGIFISYRRKDNPWATGLIHDRLAEHFGADIVFTDVESIPLGVNFMEYIGDLVAKCDVLLAVIGEKWLNISDEDGNPRLQKPEDYLRIEIESALKRGIPVIPLLLGDVRMPSSNSLPDSMKELALRNGTPIRPKPTFDSDIERLVRGIEKPLDIETAKSVEKENEATAKEIKQAADDEFLRARSFAEATPKYAGAAIAISAADRRLIHAALRNAFSMSELEQMLRIRLDKELATISESQHVNRAVSDVIVKAEQEAWLLQLIVAALDSRPDDTKLRQVAEHFGLVEEPPSEAASQSDNFVDTSVWFSRLGQIETQVCRVEIERGSTSALGTGFLVGADKILTAYHVVEKVIERQVSPRDVAFRFDYRATADGATVNSGSVFRLTYDDWLVDSSPYSPLDLEPLPSTKCPQPDELNYAILRVVGSPGSEPIGGGRAETGASKRGWIPVPTEGALPQPGQQMSILHHADGGPLKMSVETRAVVGMNANGTRLRHMLSTVAGSSGAPCFDRNLELVGVHCRKVGNLHGNESYNEAVPTKAIRNLLETRGLSHVLDD